MSDELTPEEEARILALIDTESGPVLTPEQHAQLDALRPLVVGPGPWFDAAYDNHKCGGRSYFICKLKHHVDAQQAGLVTALERIANPSRKRDGGPSARIIAREALEEFKKGK